MGSPIFASRKGGTYMGKNKLHGNRSPFPNAKKSKKQEKGVFHA